jgi:hypothetical protein
MKFLIKNKVNIKLILILLLTLNCSSLYSQNREPNQHQFMLNGVNTYLSTDLEYFNINKFILGWHWGDEYKISQALKMNQTDIGSYEDFKLNPNNNLFIRSVDTTQSPHLAFNTHCYYEPDAIYGKSLQYDPTLFIDKSNVYKLNKRDGDPSNPVFGFLNKRGRILTNSDSANYSRIIIDSASLKDSVILSEPWPSSIMYYVPIKDGVAVDSIQKNYSGRSFYISINLRRYLNSTAADSTPILKIKVPYIYWKTETLRDSLYAVFDSIPSSTNYDTTNLANNYGKIWDLIETDTNNKPREIIITRKMLPQNNEDITISGYINFGGIIELKEDNTNHKLKRLPHLHSETLNVIDSLKIEVTYLDTMQVAIDWVRFETPNARKIFHGKYDDRLIQSVQQDIDKFTQPEFANDSIKPMRWIVNIEGNPTNWGAERHFRKIVGNVVTGEAAQVLSDHYDHHIGAGDKWQSPAKPAQKATKKAKKNTKIECYTPTLQKR